MFRFRVAAAFAFALLSAPNLAQEPDQLDRADQQVLSTKAFLNAHPDIKHRTEGWFAYEAGEFARALKEFERGAWYADKLSQAMLAEMLWKGLGQPRDRELAYAWADLAAQRGYQSFVLLREKYWGDLSEDERRRAVERGRELLESYGDQFALERMSDHLRRARRSMTGGRLRRDATIIVPGENGSYAINGHDFYAAKFWEPKRYQAWVDQQWAPLPRGQVTVRRLEVVERDKAEGGKAKD